LDNAEYYDSIVGLFHMVHMACFN